MVNRRERAPSGVGAPPEAWHPARRAAMAIAAPIESFLHVEAASGILLLIAAAVALTWANSPWHLSYEHLWHTPFRVGVGEWTMERSLHFWINELLMTVFFLLAGLEIKRELAEGVLSDARRAALPIAAAAGGMLAPALIFVSLNHRPPQLDGWAIPMATDIAFAVGVLTLLGRRVPSPLRVLLLAFAIIDDVGAIIVIALFYSTGFAFDGLALAVAGVLLTLVFRWTGVRPGLVFGFPLLLMWAGLYRAGIHPTIAGVTMGLLIPVRAWFGPDGFLATARTALADFQRRASRGAGDHELLGALEPINIAKREAVSPGVRGEIALHPWVAYGVMPLFALANAGVDLRAVDFAVPGATAVLAGTAAGLLVGKPIGVLVASWIGVRIGLCRLPQGVTWGGMFVLGFAAGIGFTMAIFISELAFPTSDLLDLSKLGILGATAVAGALTLLVGRIVLHPPADGDAAPEATANLWDGGNSP